MKSEVAIAVIQGHTYTLAPDTLSVRKRKEEIAQLAQRFESGEITDEEAVKIQLDFIRDIADCHIFDHINLDMLDLADVECAVIAIINGYRNKIMREKLKALNLPAKGKKPKKGKNKK